MSGSSRTCAQSRPASHEIGFRHSKTSSNNSTLHAHAFRSNTLCFTGHHIALSPLPLVSLPKLRELMQVILIPSERLRHATCWSWQRSRLVGG